jgi:phosphoribosyl-ATP pyrophosphohydrolase/phosphoribosyl-AMP cyclohydrolase
MKPDFNKADGLLPAIIQHADTGQVLMLGYMNEEAFLKTQTSGLVTFYSRSRRALWVKGATSGNYLRLKDMFLDCDGDTLLVHAWPDGPTCHTGAETCFNEDSARGFLYKLEMKIEQRIRQNIPGSYTSGLIKKGINKIAQKVGEEAVELVIEAKDDNPDLFLGEAADLMYHFLILLKAKNLSLKEVEDVLQARSR